jgi:poly(3-hydroxybutyrate) depolymerase
MRQEQVDRTDSPEEQFGGGRSLAPFVDGTIDNFSFILVSVQGTQHAAMGRNAVGWEVWDGEEGGSYDIDFLRILHQKLLQHPSMHIDSAKVFATGHSSGAALAFRLAFQMQDIFLGVAPRAGRLFGNTQWLMEDTSTCMSLQYQYGLEDDHGLDGSALCDLAGGDYSCTGKYSIEGSILKAARANGCTVDSADPDAPEWAQSLVNTPVQTGMTMNGHPWTVYEFENCAGGAVVRFITYEDQGHSFQDVNTDTWASNVDFFIRLAQDPTRYCPSSR